MEEALKGDDKDAIEAKMQALSQASAGLAQKMYEEQAADAGAAPEAGASADTGPDDAVDAEFEEVKDEDNK